MNVEKIKMSKRQKYVFEKMSTTEQRKYIASKTGSAKHSMYVERLKTAGEYDQLAGRCDGMILAMYDRLRRTGVDHTPLRDSKGDWIGVEIECFIPHNGEPQEYEYEEDSDEYMDLEEAAQNALAADIRDAGLKRVSVKGDGSLSSEDGYAVEVTCLFNINEGFEPLKKLCKVLSENKCFTNKSCGLHVHLDVRKMNRREVKELGSRIGRCLGVLQWMVPASRHDNRYCKLRVGPMIDKHEARYHAVNMTAWFKFQTIEVRLHGGTIDFKKIKNWIEILNHIRNSNFSAKPKTFQDFIDKTQLPDRLVSYVEERINELNKGAWAKLMPGVYVFNHLTGNAEVA